MIMNDKIGEVNRKVEVVRLENITKQYPGVLALNHADLVIRSGEIHALLGENGAGKTTLMKVLYGMTVPDEGEIYIRQKQVRFSSPIEAIAAGIGMVHQHFMQADMLTVLENVIAGAEVSVRGRINYRQARRNVQEMIQQFAFDLDPDSRIEELSVGERQRVEILKVLYRGGKILIFDEPTAVLTPLETEAFFTVLRKFKEQGKSIVIITHKLQEVMAIADRITVMRDGAVTGHCEPEDVSINDLAAMMVKREIKVNQHMRAGHIGSDVYFEVKNLTLTAAGKTVLDRIHLKIHKGEILGIAGVEGNGQTELIRCLTGLQKPDEMELFLDGEAVTGNASDFISRGIGHVPEDRLGTAVVESESISINLMLGYHFKEWFRRGRWMDYKKAEAFGNECMKKYSIKAPSARTTIAEMSGGNQQKVVIARVFSENPKVVICAQPTRGVDIGSIEYIHQRMREFVGTEYAMLLISADLEEVKAMSDRIAVIYKGRIVAEGQTDAFDDTQMGLYMTGSKKGAER